MIYVTGDMHGDIERINSKDLKILKEGDTLIVCGDFGYLWTGDEYEQKLLENIGNRKYTVCFVDGTHENFEMLNQHRMTVWNGGRVHRISGNLFHMMRGQIFNIEGKTFFTFGGGESRDRDLRTDNETWWREEMPTPDEMAEGAETIDEAGGEVDFIITHEPPSLVKSSMLLRTGDRDSVNKLNGYLEQINRECKFHHWYFGSVHEDRRVTPRHTAVFREIIRIG